MSRRARPAHNSYARAHNGGGWGKNSDLIYSRSAGVNPSLAGGAAGQQSPAPGSPPLCERARLLFTPLFTRRRTKGRPLRKERRSPDEAAAPLRKRRSAEAREPPRAGPRHLRADAIYGQPSRLISDRRVVCRRCVANYPVDLPVRQDRDLVSRGDCRGWAAGWTYLLLIVCRHVGDFF